MLVRLGVCLFALLLETFASAATESPLTIDALKTMITGLGFEPTGDGKNYVAINESTVAGPTIFFALDPAGAGLKIYSPFSSIAKDRTSDIPALAMLQFNNTHDFTYSLSTADGKDRVVLEKTLDAGFVTPATLRKSIESLKAEIEEGRKLWKRDRGSAVPGQSKASDTYATALADADAIWAKSPLELHHVMFVLDKPSVFGAYKARDSNVFKAGEPILTYLEPFGYSWKARPGGIYEFGVAMDYTLEQGSRVLASQDRVLFYSNASKDKIRELMLNLSLNFSGLLPGRYDLRYTVHDAFSAKTATATIPLEIVE